MYNWLSGLWAHLILTVGSWQGYIRVVDIENLVNVHSTSNTPVTPVKAGNTADDLPGREVQQSERQVCSLM